MKETLSTIRHLSGYVETQLTQFTQLKTAISDILALSETLADRQRQLKDCEAAITQAQQRLTEATANQEQYAATMAQQRRELQALLQQERAARQKEREAVAAEQAAAQQAQADAAGRLRAFEQQIVQKQQELARLHERLKATVEGVLTH